MIRITKNILLDENEIEEEFIRSSGPGGQNVNKVSTAVQLRFDLNRTSLPDEIKNNLIRIAGKRITGNNVLIISARRFRTQEGNRRDARERLVNMIRKAGESPRRRKKTKPTGASVERRLRAKRIKSEKKKQRSF